MEEQDIINLKDKLVSLNIIREELIKLDLNPKQKLFYEYNIEPLLNTFHYLGFASFDFSNSASLLNNINFSKSSEIKDTLDLIYDIRKLSDDVFCELEKQVKILIKLYK